MQETATEKLHRYFLKSNGISTDTRNIAAQSMFVALKGENFDGNLFVKQAISSGAACAITSDPDAADNTTIFYVKDTLIALQQLANYHRTQFNIPVIAITGSNGKTTTKELFYTVLSKKYNTLATKGNLNNHIGVPLTLLQLNDTHEMAVIEMGANHQGEIDLLCHIAEPTIGLITNIGKAHLEGFGGIEGVIKGKTELYRFLQKQQGLILFNSDNPVLKEHISAENKLSYAFLNNADCKGKMINERPFLSLIYSYLNENTVQVQSNLIGLYNAENILSAICMAKFFNVDDKMISEAIEAYAPDNSRSQIIKRGSNTIILDAYNANPSSMKAALDNFSTMESKKKIVLLGDMFELGEDATKEHENIIKEALKGNFNLCIFIGPEFARFKDTYPAVYFNTTNDCVAFLNEAEYNEFTFLIKGSRGMQLEKLLPVFE